MNTPTITRAAYMNGETSHQDYYLGIANIIGREAIEAMVKPVIEGYTLESAGEHLNGIPLYQWDALDYRIRRLVSLKSAEVMAASWGGAPFKPGTFSWSYAETTCTAKAVAKFLLESRKR